MSIFHNNGLIGASGQGGGAGGYSISRSLRFNSSDSAYLSRTPASAGNRKTWTWAGWVKRSGTGAVLDHIFLGSLVTDAEGIRFNSSDKIQFYLNGGSFAANLITTQVFRDFSAWYHIVVAVDTTQATASNRVKLYINGSQITAFDTSTYPSQNYDCPAINTTAVHWIGANIAGPFYSNFYLADCYLIDGSALTPSSFTETDATTGQLIPKAYTGSYGTNGFHLEFADNSSNTATTLGKDTSGNGNNWTPNNLSVTAGAGNDSLVDVPTNGTQTDTGVGGEVRGNYATWNPLEKAANATLSNGNLDIAQSSGDQNTGATVSVSSGKWYWEVAFASGTESRIGAIKQQFVKTDSPFSAFLGGGSNGYSYANGGYKSNANNNSATGYSTYTTNDVISVALDLDNGKIFFAKNGVWQESGNPATGANPAYSGLSGTFTPAVYTPNATLNANFGQRQWAYAAPAGFKALCDTNLPAPVVAKSASAFQAITYTGTGANATIPNVNTVPTSIDFTPDLVWIKGRSGATDHALYDSVRDVQKDLVSNSTAAETTQSTGLTAFGTNTFNIGTLAKLNTSSSTYVAWCWDAGSSTVTNTQGSITSSVRANATAGFSVISYVGTGSAGASIGHGLGVAPAFALFKNRSVSSDWQVYHVSLGNAQSILLQSTAAAGSSSAFNSTSPTSTIITLGAGTSLNNNGSNHICYAFAPVVGYSSFGSYTGNGSGSPDGPFIYTGFRPRWILFKNASTTNGWRIMDTSINPYNVVSTGLYPYLSNAEDSATNWQVDYLSNGFKVRSNSGQAEINGSGNTIIYAAFAESPFNYSRAR